ncbi:phage-related baseplate assembly protein [Bacillus sp. OxB-1]|uniref:baseplate assembly protein n=1 Tax=Bacillus sp. (strain OxB-1) TaxID=98228 RepID=UPI0005820437|nr:baseplate J/gp47 family protein [Bacillus sp. OxB-1]BAQ11437.1 phage-related baseplate assembly protein [Bacillus sp. OxB-1]
MSRFNLPDLYFLEKAPELVEREMLLHVEDKTGVILQRADPRRKFIQGLAAYVSIERNKLEHGLRQNRLSYAEDNMLDHMGVEMSTERLPAKFSKTTMAFVLEEDRVDALSIPAGTRFLVAEDIYFETIEPKVIPKGVHLFSVGAVCTQPGDIGNGFLPGEITILVEPLPYVKLVQNTTISAGGAEEETDDAYAERIRLAPESFSVAGPDGAYIYWAKSASQEIVDVKVDSSEPGVVDVRILMANGRLPVQEEIEHVESILMDRKVRPLTDFVRVGAPTNINYTSEVEYWIAESNAAVSRIIEKQVNQAYQEYLIWQRSKMGRDVDFSELIARLKQAGASRVSVNSPMFIKVDKLEVAVEVASNIIYRGLADD